MIEKPERRVTQKDIAARAGVHRATVSLALKGHPGIPDSTKNKIKKIAEELGYLPDPMLSALASYRCSIRPSSFHGNLAWIVHSGFGFNWKSSRHFKAYYSGAVHMAKTRGFRFEIFDLNSPRMTPARMASILRARSIPGILLCPQPQAHMELDFHWGEFSAVTFGYTLQTPALHTVAAAHFRAVRTIMAQLRSRGYKRIGLIMDATHDSRIDNNYSGAYLADLHEHGEVPSIPILSGKINRNAKDLIGNWIKEHKPDAIISSTIYILEIIRALNIKVPEKLGVVCLSQARDTMNPDLSSIIDDSEHIGMVAVDFLVGMIQRGERGIPVNQQRLLVEGHWNEGCTLRKAPST